MDSEIRNISYLSYNKNKLETNKNESETETEADIKATKDNSKDFTKLKIKNILKGKRKKKKKHSHINVNYARSNCLSKLFFYWPRKIFKIANKGNLTHEDVCNVSKEQSIKFEMDKIKSTFLKYSSGKFKNYSLVITIFLSNCKLLFLLFILDIINVGLDYARMFFFRQIISTFSKSIFFPPREKFNFFSAIKHIENFPFNIYEAVSLYIIIRIIKSLLFNHIEFNNSKLISKITNQMIALLTEKIIKSNSIYKTDSGIGEGELLNMAEVDAEIIGSFFFSGPRIITAPIKVIISMYLLFKIFGFYFLYVLLVLILIILVISILQIVYIKNLKKLLFFKDKRMKIVSYVFHTLKCLKLNSLDDEFIKRIREKREDELKYTNKTTNIDLITFVINSNINLILIIFTLYFCLFK